MLTTEEMKYYILSYYRFQRQYPMTATEVGIWGGYIADVLASDYKEFIEVEIKISENDLINDFQHKEEKHTAYLDTTLHKTATLPTELYAMMPNKFLYAVPVELYKTALELIKGTPYGLIYVDTNNMKLSANSFVKVAKHSNTINRVYPKKLEHACIARMSSEIINLYETLLDI